MLGNPPWLKVEWNEAGILGEVNPLFAIRKLSATELAQLRSEAFAQFPACKRLDERTGGGGSDAELPQRAAELPVAQGHADQSLQVLHASWLDAGRAAAWSDICTRKARMTTRRAERYAKRFTRGLRAHFQFHQ